MSYSDEEADIIDDFLRRIELDMKLNRTHLNVIRAYFELWKYEEDEEDVDALNFDKAEREKQGK